MASDILFFYMLKLRLANKKTNSGERITRPCGATLFTKEGKVRTLYPLPPLVKGVPSADGGGFAFREGC